MLNMTSRLAVDIRFMPNWEVDWMDTTPQRDTATLTISDLLPDENDGLVLQKRANEYIMRFLTTEYQNLSYLQPLLPLNLMMGAVILVHPK